MGIDMEQCMYLCTCMYMYMYLLGLNAWVKWRMDKGMYIDWTGCMDDYDL